MAFVNRIAELDYVRRLAEEASAGRQKRHVAFVGVRRIGKSRIVEHYRDNDPPVAVAHVAIDSATATLPSFLRAFVRATVNAVARSRGVPEADKTADDRAVVALAARLDARLTDRVLQAQAAATQRRPDNQHLFESALAFTEVVAGDLDQPFLVVADEFQHVVDLAVYPPFDAGRKLRAAEARNRLLAVVRTHVEAARRVGWVVTGSSVRLLQDILNAGPLMGRFDVRLVGPFDDEDCIAHAEALWEETGTEAHPQATARIVRLTQGHPFYTDVTCREAAHIAQGLDRAVNHDMVEAAFVTAIFQPHGQISIACKEMYDSIAGRTPGLRGLVDALAALPEPASLPALGEHVGITSPPSLYRFADELVAFGIFEAPDPRAPRQYVFADPVFRYWVAKANDPDARPAAFSPDAIRRLARVYDEAYRREREMHGHLSEGFLRDLCRSFNGQSLDGRRFGMPGRHVRVPIVDTVTTIRATDPTRAALNKSMSVDVELDLCFGRDELWLGEVKRRAERATAADVATLMRKDAFLRNALNLPAGRSWFVSYYGFEQAARDLAATHGVYTSTMPDLQAIRAAAATRR